MQSNFSFSQTNDSKSNKQFESLIATAKQLRKNQLADSSIKILIQAKSLAKFLKDDKKIAQAHLALANTYYWGIADYFKCKKELDTVAQKYFSVLTQKQKCAYLSQYGDAVYYELDYAQSVQYYFKALQYVDTDSVMLARIYHNIGWVYTDLGKYEKGIEFGKKALDVAEKSNGDVNHKLEGLVYIYKTAKQFINALKCQDRLLQMDTSRQQVAFNFYQKSAIYSAMQKHDSALYFCKNAYLIATELNATRWEMMFLSQLLITCIDSEIMKDFESYLSNYEALLVKFDKPYEADEIYTLAGEYYISKKDFKKAKQYLDKSKTLQEQYKREHVEKTYYVLSDWYRENNDFTKAYLYLKKYTDISDSLFLIEKEKYKKTLDNFTKIFDLENVLDQNKVEIQNKNLLLQNEKTQKYLIFSGLIFVLVVAAFFLKVIVDRKKMNKVLLEKNETIELKNELLSTKNKEILDSISYAKRLQEAILPSKKLVHRYLENSFIYYKPKDIVAGDFYWMEVKNNIVFFAAADCTGHGVPGAMVSVVCSNALNRTVKEFEIAEPGKILDKVRDLVLETFEKSESEVKDGMDISLCAYDVKQNKLLWAGANNPLWIIRPEIGDMRYETDKKDSQISNLNSQILLEYAPDKQPIGATENKKAFVTKEITLQTGDTFYVFTDGYADQFGGEKGKKFKTANLKKLLLSIQNNSMEKQLQLIHENFETWKGSLEQVDDVCIIGVRV